MSILGLVVLSTRAAFFNPVIRGRRGKRREKEFADYKQYMSKFYDTSSWDLDWVPEIAEDKKVGEDEETDSTSGGITPSNSEDSTPGLVPALVSSSDGSVFLNLAVPVQEEQGGVAEAGSGDDGDADKDNDSDYDSTYSYDSQDDLRSTTSSSVFSTISTMLQQLRRTRSSHDPQQQPNRLQVSSSGSSISTFGRFLYGRTPVHSNASSTMLSLSSEEKHRYKQRQGEPKSYLNKGFFHDEESDEDDSVDSVAGVLQYPALSEPPAGWEATRNSGYEVNDGDPDRLELEPLSPPSQQPQSANRRRIRVRRDDGADDLELVPLTPPTQPPQANRRRSVGRITEIS